LEKNDQKRSSSIFLQTGIARASDSQLARLDDDGAAGGGSETIKRRENEIHVLYTWQRENAIM